jgi:reverse transcriptase-like protein
MASRKAAVDRTRRQLLKSSLILGTATLLGRPSDSHAATGERPHGVDLRSIALPRAAVERAVDLAVANVIAEGIDDVFDRPFELDMLAERPALRRAVKRAVVDRLTSTRFDLSAFEPVEHVLMPKRRLFEYRRCAVLEPLDTITYLTLAILAGEAIESGRPASPRDVVLSYRFAPTREALFDPRYTYRRFIGLVDRTSRSSNVGFVAELDVESFYDRIDLGWLAERLGVLGVDPGVADRAEALLRHWAPGGVGLPVGSNASRVFAEAVLTSVDDVLLEHGVAFTRYVDDYRIFTRDGASASRALGLVVTALARRGLTPNPYKTRILSAATHRALHERRDFDGITLVDDTAPEAKPAEPAEKPAHAPAKPPKKPTRPGAGDKTTQPDGARRYSGLMPHRFELPGPDAVDAVFGAPAADGFEAFRNDPTPTFVREFVTGALVPSGTSAALRLPELVATFPACAAYVADALFVCQDRLAPTLRRAVAKGFAQLLDDPRAVPDFVVLRVVALLSAEPYRRRESLVRFFDRLGDRAGSYVGRFTVDALRQCDGPGLGCVAWPAQASRGTRRALAAYTGQCPPPGAASTVDPFTASLMARTTT